MADISDPFHELLAEQAGGADEQEGKRHDIGEPTLDTAAEILADIDLRELLRSADQQAADNGAEDGIEAAENEDRQRLQDDERERELHAEARAPEQTGNKRNET